MTNGIEMALYQGNRKIADAKDTTITVSQEAEMYEPLPNTLPEGEDEWEFYRPGARSWGIQNSGFYTYDTAQGWQDLIINRPNLLFAVQLTLSAASGVSIHGNVRLQNTTIDASAGSLAKFNADVVGENFPSIS